jgi:predicted CxxxxCH...CXXCH cytochrome family protein
MKRQYSISIFPIIILALFLMSCSDLKKDLPTAMSSETKIHDTGWNDPASGDFHGQFLKAAGWSNDNCASCHSTTFKGGTSEISCFTCHSQYPHPAGYANITGHPVSLRVANYPLAECQSCHGANYTGGSAVNVSCERSGCHVDGSGNLKSPEACNTCHGNFLAAASDTLSWAPPKSLSNDSSTSIRGIGAHQQHLANAIIVSGNKVACMECHIVPATVSASGHLGASPAKVVFSGSLASLQTNNGVVIPNPSYNSSNGKCNNSYCHGYFKNGNLTNAPVWNIVDGSQKKCGSCHGNPLTGSPKPVTGPHQYYADGDICQDCHYVGKQPTAVYTNGQWTITDIARHMNGTLSWFGTEQGF